MPDNKKETWRDPAWFPDGMPEPTEDELITRDELIGRLARNGVGMTESTLQKWERAGIVPGPVRRKHPSSKRARALYPPWMVDLVQGVPNPKRFGLEPEVSRARNIQAVRNYADHRRLESQGDTQALMQAVRVFARSYMEATGKRPTEAIVILQGTGQAKDPSYHLPLDNLK